MQSPEKVGPAKGVRQTKGRLCQEFGAFLRNSTCDKKIHCCKMRLLTFPVRGWKSCNDDSNPHVGQRMNPTSVSGQLQDRIN